MANNGECLLLAFLYYYRCVFNIGDFAQLHSELSYYQRGCLNAIPNGCYPKAIPIPDLRTNSVCHVFVTIIYVNVYKLTISPKLLPQVR